MGSEITYLENPDEVGKKTAYVKKNRKVHDVVGKRMYKVRIRSEWGREGCQYNPCRVGTRSI